LMSRRDWTLFVADMLEACDKIIDYTSGMSFDASEIAILRVAARVRQGGHSIPESVIRRRFAAGLTNFETIYKSEVDRWAKFDNLGDRPVLIEWGKFIRDA